MQDHRWLGNAYFAGKGARIIVLQRTVDGQKRYADNCVAQLKDVLKDRFEGTVPLAAREPVQADQTEFELGGHGPLAALAWRCTLSRRCGAVPAPDWVLFAGDLVFHNRMLGLWPHSPVDAWRDTFHAMERLNPRVVVPGHGEPGDLARTRRDTGDYLDFLMDQVAHAARE